MNVVRTLAGVREALAEPRREGAVVGFVPTMGALHEGHLQLLRAARESSDVTVLSIFVNPLQFGADEDLSRYPRSEARDLEVAEREKTDVAFLPSVEDMYPSGADVRVSAGRLGTILEGAARPGHFDGVCTVVAKLFNLIEPDRAFFGQKDAQQVAVIKAMVRDLSYRIRIEVCPTVREHDGLAVSSRNAYLSEEERTQAPALFNGLRRGAKAIEGGADASAAEALMADVISSAGFELDYARVVEPDTCEPWTTGPALLVAAASLGSTRLIDNVVVETQTSVSGHTR